MDRPSPSALLQTAVESQFIRALRGFLPDGPVLLLGHHDADGLSSTALLARAFAAAGRDVTTRIVGRGENAWSSDMAGELAPLALGGIVAADLGVRAGPIKDGTPLLVIDHHVPAGVNDASVISGYGQSPAPTTSLLAFWCARALAGAERADEWLWLAALGLIGDMAEKSGFEEMALARERYGVTALRTLTALVNAPRRSASADARPALALLLAADGPGDALSGRHSEIAALYAARDEVQGALERVKRVAPIVRDGVALILFDSPCQLHPLLAQQWRARLRNEIVLAANTGYRPGWVHFAVRTAQDLNLIDFLARHAPIGVDEHYGGGHEAATGGALRVPDWNAFIKGLGFGAEAQVTA